MIGIAGTAVHVESCVLRSPAALKMPRLFVFNRTRGQGSLIKSASFLFAAKHTFRDRDPGAPDCPE